MAGSGDEVRRLPQFIGIEQISRAFGMNVGVEEAVTRLQGDWWCTMGRELPYSDNSNSKLVEVYVVTKSDHVTGFSTATGGRIIDHDGRGGVGDACMLPRSNRVFVINDSPPLLAFFCLHNDSVLRAFRFRVELHFAESTKNKLDVQQYLQRNIRDIHPVILPMYFKGIVLAAKGKINNVKGDANARFEYVTRHFLTRIEAYKAALRCEEAKRKQRERDAQEHAAQAAVRAAYSAYETVPSARIASPVVASIVEEAPTSEPSFFLPQQGEEVLVAQAVPVSSGAPLMMGASSPQMDSSIGGASGMCDIDDLFASVEHPHTDVTVMGAYDRGLPHATPVCQGVPVQP